MRRLSILVCVAILATACTGDPITDEEPTASPTDSAVSPTGTAAGSETPGGFSEGQDVLDVATAEPLTLDPMRIQDPGAVLIARQLYEGLTSWDPELQEVVPGAAESWKVAAKGRRFTFSLRDGMTFHDGSPVRSVDFAYAFNRIARKKSGSAIAYTLDRVEGFGDVNQLGDAKELEGISTPDPLTLVIELSEPFQDFPAVLTHPGLVPLKKSDVSDPDRFLSEPNGNGAFELAEPWGPGDPVILRRFDGFIRTPSLDGIRFHPFPDAAASWLRFVGGEFDVAEVPAGQIEAATEQFGEDSFAPFLATYNFGLNIRSGNLKKRKLRRAISRSIDRERIATEIYRGTMVPPRGIVPQGMPGFEDDACIGLCDYAPDAARALVDDLSRGKRSVRLEYTEGEPHDRVARMVRGDLQQAGLSVTLRSFPFSRYVKRLRRGEQQMYRLGWIAEYPTPDVFLDGLFESNSPDNHSRFSSGRVDSILRKAQSEADPERRVELYRKVEELVLVEIPIVPIGSFLTHWATQETVEGLAFDAMGGFDAVLVSLPEN